MRRPKNPKAAAKKVSPNPVVFHRSFSSNPQALKREISNDVMRNYSDDTIFYGEDDALPLRIAHAIEESPAASACIDTIAQFIKGGGFSNPELGKIKIDKNGTTLWDFHCSLADTIALFNGFAVNFKYNDSARITNSYILSFESVRFKKPPENDPYIHHIAFNPYFGTDLYNRDQTISYPVYDNQELKKQLSEFGTKFTGQVYYWGKTSPLHRFYPVPKYWTGKKWIYIDGRIQEAHAENLDNGWFQSVLMNVIGDPNAPSQNPKYQETYTNSDGEIKQRSTKTIGEEFSDQMAATFSGSKKMGTVQVMWSMNTDDSAKISPFPTNANADLFIALQDLTTKNITIATRVPSILANISEGVSLGSGGSEMQKAVELMQSRTAEFRMILESFYNDVLLPNLAKPIAEKISIVNFNPITQPVEIDEKVWEFLNELEKAEFIKKNFPGVTLFRTAAPAPAVDPDTGDPLPIEPSPVTGNDALKNINQKQLDRILSIVRRYNIGQVDPGNKQAVTLEQAKQLLLSFGLTESDMNAWLITPEEA